MAMIDPPRPQVGPAIAKCQEAGIRVVMITGDDAHTAESVGRSVGLLREHEIDHVAMERTGVSLSGEFAFLFLLLASFAGHVLFLQGWTNALCRSWASLDGEARKEAASKVVIMYRVEPQHKV